MQPTTAELILAVTGVAGFTEACKSQGDAAAFTALSRYYAAVADAAGRADGRVVKLLGDGVLLTFPIERCGQAVEVLRELQQRSSKMWHGFDERCHVQVKVGLGQVACGHLGPPGEERFDIVGDALNQLFKAPWGDFDLSPAVLALVR